VSLAANEHRSGLIIAAKFDLCTRIRVLYISARVLLIHAITPIPVKFVAPPACRKSLLQLGLSRFEPAARAFTLESCGCSRESSRGIAAISVLNELSAAYITQRSVPIGVSQAPCCHELRDGLSMLHLWARGERVRIGHRSPHAVTRDRGLAWLRRRFFTVAYSCRSRW
jgi:hypothetical protein